jgi:hypothetical protein
VAIFLATKLASIVLELISLNLSLLWLTGNSPSATYFQSKYLDGTLLLKRTISIWFLPIYCSNFLTKSTTYQPSVCPGFVTRLTTETTRALDLDRACLIPLTASIGKSITPTLHDEIATDLEKRQQELNDRLKLLTNDNKDFQVTASYLLDLAQRAEQLFNESDDDLHQKLSEYVLSNIELKDKKLSYILNDPFRTIVETKKKPFRAQIQTFGATGG